MKLIYEGPEVIGFYQKVSVLTLRTTKAPYVAAVPCKYHGVNVTYHADPEAAEAWIREYIFEGE